MKGQLMWLRPLAITGIVLLMPLIAMQFSREVNWSVMDFAIIGILLFTVSFIYELATRKWQTKKQRIVIGLVLGAITMYLWAELAVGIFTNLGS